MREKSKKTADTMPAMLAYVKTHPAHATGIVYCFSKKDCEKAAAFLTFNKVRRGEERSGEGMRGDERSGEGMRGEERGGVERSGEVRIGKDRKKEYGKEYEEE